MNPAAVPLPHQHMDLQHRRQLSIASSSSSSASSVCSTKKIMRSSPPHPHAHGYHRRRLTSPISPLSTTYNTHSLNKTKDEVIASCDREVQWATELEYGLIIEEHMKDEEVITKLLRLSISDVNMEFQERHLAAAEMMDLQPELEWYMLPFLVDFLIEVHSQFHMSPETLHLALNLVNRYVSKRVVFKKHYQLVGCSALWIAAKFSDAKDKVPTVSELRNMCVSAYEEDMFVQMEGHVLATLGWELGGVQTTEAFIAHQIARLRGQHGHVDPRLIHLSRFFVELSLFSREFLSYKPSEIAAAAVALARHILGSQQFVQQRYTDEEIDCVELLLAKMSFASAILRRKYANRAVLNVTSVMDDFLAQAARKEFQTITPPSSAQAHCPPLRMSQVKTPDLHIQLPDTPPHTPITASTVPTAKSKPGYCVGGAGLPTPPADDDNKSMHHIHPNEFTRGTYRRSDSFIETTLDGYDEDMDTEYDTDDEEMTYEDEEGIEEYDSDVEDTMIMDHQHQHQHHQHQHLALHSLHHHHEPIPRIVLASVV
jgi:Cyclin, N-terminal domain/Cyclin, C-terminal domain